MIICTQKDDLFSLYKDRVYDKSVRFHIKDIFIDWWDKYKFSHPHVKRRDIVDIVINKFLLCKTFLLGYSLYTCDKCHTDKVVPNTCKTRFCSACGNKYNEARSISIFSKLFAWKHRHVVFTIPEDLRLYFNHDRKLLDLLFKASSITIKYWFYNKYKNVTPAFISILHTFGRDLKWNPHIHMILLDGGISDKDFIKINFFSYASFRKRFMKVLLDLLQSNLNSKDFKRIKNDLYFRYNDGFYVYAPPNKFKKVNDLIKYVCRYVARPVMAESRIIDYDGTFVTFWYQRHEDDLIVIEKIHAYDFMHRLVIHIPDYNFKYIRFYGAYHNSTKINIDVNKLISKEKINLKLSLNRWRSKIIWNFSVDPLECLNCHNLMVYYKSYYP